MQVRYNRWIWQLLERQLDKTVHNVCPRVISTAVEKLNICTQLKLGGILTVEIHQGVKVSDLLS